MEHVIKDPVVEDLLAKYDYSWPMSNQKEFNRVSASSEPVSMKQAIHIFDTVYEEFSDFFNHTIGCEVKAHLICGYLFEHGIRPSKAWWINEQDPGEKRAFNLRNLGLEWWFHVAPAITVQNHRNDKPMIAVIDPLVFDGPVTVSAWADAFELPVKDVVVRDYDKGLEKDQDCMYRPNWRMKNVNSIMLYEHVSKHRKYTNVKIFPNRYKSKLREDFERQQHDLRQAHYTKNAKALRLKISV